MNRPRSELDELRAFKRRVLDILDRLRGYQFCPLCRGEAAHHEKCEFGKLDEATKGER